MKARRLPDGTRCRARDLPDMPEPLIEDHVALSGPGAWCRAGTRWRRPSPPATWGSVVRARFAAGLGAERLGKGRTFPFHRSLLYAAPDDALAARRYAAPRWSREDRSAALRDGSRLPVIAQMWAVAPSEDDPANDGPWERHETERP
jgi:hypothetical protein